MRYIVEVDGLSAEVLKNLKKNGRIIHIFSLIDNTIAIETENIERIKESNDVKHVYESGKAKLMLRDALNIIGIYLKPDIIAPSCISYGNFKLAGTSIATPFVSASAAELLSADKDRGRVIRSIFSTAVDKGFPIWVQGHGLIRTDKALEVVLCD